MNIILKRITKTFTIILILLNVFAINCHALPYSSFAYDEKGGWIAIQAPYVPVEILGNPLITDEQTETGGISHDRFKNPSDIYIDKEGLIYVADTGNNRIVCMNDNGEVIRILGQGKDVGSLKRPNGVFVDDNGVIYVADTDNHRIAVFNNDGSFMMEFKNISNEYLPADYSFIPLKLSVDKRGFVFTVTRGGFYGLTQINPNGEFESIFGGNKVELDWLQTLKRFIYTKEQLSRELIKLPGLISNVHIESDSFIYVCSEKVEEGQLKKLNIGGKDVFENRKFKIGKGKNDITSFTDVVVDKNGFITCIDNYSGAICQYDQNGELMLAFGATKQEKPRLGVFMNPISIAINPEGNLYVLDSKTGFLHAFRLTEFGSLVQKATKLYNEGQHVESEEPWRRILELNPFYYRAHSGLGKIYMREGKWKEAMEEFKYARDKEGYSDAFWQLRLEWMQKNFTFIASGLLVLYLFHLAWTKAHKKKKFIREGSVK